MGRTRRHAPDAPSFTGTQFTDIHCHLLPAVDDGPGSWSDTLRMARMAANDGVRCIIATPHQLGSYAHVSAAIIRDRVAQVQRLLQRHGIPLRVLPGADVRIEPEMLWHVLRGKVLTLADRRRHVLLELPHDLCFPLESLREQLQASRLVGILSHPERNQALLADPHRIARLVDSGYLMQITAASLHGNFGPRCRRLAEWMVREGMVHFVASDAHGPTARRPLLGRAYARVAQLAGESAARTLLWAHPQAVVEGRDVPPGRRAGLSRSWNRWLPWRKAG